MMEDMLGSFRGWKGEVWAVEGGEEEKNFDELFTVRELSRGRRGQEGVGLRDTEKAPRRKGLEK